MSSSMVSEIKTLKLRTMNINKGLCWLLICSLGVGLSLAWGQGASQNRVSKALRQVQKKPTANLYLVSIGISKYVKNEFNLTYADDDARGIHQTFTSTRNKQLFKDIKSKLLLNEQATYGNIIQSFRWLEKNATSRDLVILFISGQGFRVGDKFYILPYGGSPDKLELSGIEWNGLNKSLERLNCPKLVLLDACRKRQLGGCLTKSQKALKSRRNGTVLFSSVREVQTSQEALKWRHGAFALALIEALEGKADVDEDGIVFLKELDQYTVNRVKALTSGAQKPLLQKPISITELSLSVVK